jgi:phosphatidylserine decarboxylase
MVALIFLIILIMLLLIFLFYKFVFLRDPERKIPTGRNIVAPADGRIIKITELKKISSIGIRKRVLGRIKAYIPGNCKDGFMITIMMNLFDVHVQRTPIEGKVLAVNHKAGAYKNAVFGNAFQNGLFNEKNEITIKAPEVGVIKVIQIAGFLARRIICFVKKNDKVNKGNRLGKILLGSQVCLIIPRMTLSVKEGARVRAGESVLGTF